MNWALEQMYILDKKKKHRLISQKQTMDIVDTNTSDIFYLFLRKQKLYSISDKSLKTQIALISPLGILAKEN